MRTAGQGQAAVRRERVRRRRAPGLPGPAALGRGENIPRTVTDAVERYPEVPAGSCGGGIRLCHGRLTRTWLFCLRDPGCVPE